MVIKRYNTKAYRYSSFKIDKSNEMKSSYTYYDRFDRAYDKAKENKFIKEGLKKLDEVYSSLMLAGKQNHYFNLLTFKFLFALFLI